MFYYSGTISKQLLCPMLLLLLQLTTWVMPSGSTYESEWLSKVFPSMSLTSSPPSATSARDLIPRYVLALYDEMRFQDEHGSGAQKRSNKNDAIRSFKVQMERG